MMRSNFLVAHMLLLCQVSPTAASPVAVGDPAPFFALADYKGKVVLIDF